MQMWSAAFGGFAMGRKISCYKRPKVIGDRCLDHGISPFGNTEVKLAANYGYVLPLSTQSRRSRGVDFS